MIWGDARELLVIAVLNGTLELQHRSKVILYIFYNFDMASVVEIMVILGPFH